MKVDLLITNAKIVEPNIGIFAGSVAIDDGKIVSICKDANVPTADKVIDAKGNTLFPGVIDPHTHLGSQRPVEDDFLTETSSAAVGGVTTLINYFRRNDSYKTVFPSARDSASRKSIIDFAFHLALVNDLQLSELEEYLELYGISSFKLHLDYKVTGLPMASGPDISIDDGLVFRIFEKLSQLKRTKATIHCENIEIIRDLTRRVKLNRSGLEAWADSRPGFAEAENLLRMMYLASITGANIHSAHVSARETVDLLRRFQTILANVSAETQIHYLTLTKDCQKGVLAKVKPPLRNQEDVEAVWAGLDEGLITSISSDHVPNRQNEKIGSGDFWTSAMGFPACPLVLPLMISEGYHKRDFPLEKIAAVTSSNTAKTFNLYPKKGMIIPGSDADLVILDLTKEQKVTPELLRSRSDYSVFEGKIVKGWPIMTIVRGNVVFADGEVVGKPGSGQYLERK